MLRESSRHRSYTLHDSISIPVWKRQPCKDRRHISDAQGLGWKEELTIKGRKRTFWGDGPAPCHDYTCLSKLKELLPPKGQTLCKSVLNKPNTHTKVTKDNNALTLDIPSNSPLIFTSVHRYTLPSITQMDALFF